ncbi:hypothetical protein [Methanolobus sp.]|nr:hypothetical protein [Methanolobus sp.]
MLPSDDLRQEHNAIGTILGVLGKVANYLILGKTSTMDILKSYMNLWLFL